MTFDLALAFGMGLTTFVYAFLAVNFRKNHAPLQLLFLGMTIISAVATSWLLVLLAQINVQTTIETILNSQYTMMIFVLMFVFAYMIITFLFDKLRELGHFKNNDADSE